MNKLQVKKRIEELKRAINRYRYLYHVLDREEVSQDALDSLKHELKKLEDAHPEYITPDSPTQRVAGKPLEKFVKVRHRIKQWSLEDAFSEKELKEWETRVRRAAPDRQLDYIGELKIDGLHIVLTYEKGMLSKGATRGDGEVGEDVTQNLRTIEAIPLTLAKPVSCVVGGEVFMRKHVFEELNRARAKKGEVLLANPRNASAGAIRQLDPRIAAARRLDCFTYDIEWISEGLPSTQEGELTMLASLGFKVNKHWRRLNTIVEVIAYWKHWEKKRETQDYWIDGTVIKINRRDAQERLGYTGKAPRFIIAAKFAGKEVTTVAMRVVPSIGRTGKITPVAFLTPVTLQGSTVSRASLHNYDEVARLDVRKGDTVVVVKAGDIIPQVTRVLKELRRHGAKATFPPRVCPACKTPLVREKDLVDYLCPNRACASTRARSLIYFFSKAGLNAQGLGEKIIERLLDEGLIQNRLDVFDLRKEDIASLKGFGETSAQNIIQAVEKAKHLPLWRFLAALGIDEVGSQTALLIERWIEKQYGEIKTPRDLAAILIKLRKEKLEEIGGIGPKVSESIISFARSKDNQVFLIELSKRGIVFLAPRQGKNAGKARGKTFVFSGSLAHFTREEAKERVVQQGGKVASRISRGVDYLVAGERTGSKIDTAKRLGVKIIDEEAFLKMME